MIPQVGSMLRRPIRVGDASAAVNTPSRDMTEMRRATSGRLV
jgi:hypothetical protein